MENEAQVVALTAPDAEEPFGFGMFVSAENSALFSDRSIPTFKLDATSELLHRLSDVSTGSGEIFRLVLSESSSAAMRNGLAELMPARSGEYRGQVRKRSTGRIMEHARLVEAAVPFAATPHGMAALITVAAVTELALVLQQAFEVLHEEIRRVRDMLEANYRSQLQHDLAVAQSALDAAKLGEEFLRAGASPPSGAGLGPHSQAIDTLYLQYRNQLRDLQRQAKGFLAGKDPRADDYLKHLKKLLPYDVHGLSGAVIVFSAAALAKLHVDAVRLGEAQLRHGTLQPVSTHLEVQAQQVRSSTLEVRAFTAELARRDFGSDLKPRGKKPVSGGFLSKMPEAMRVQRQLRRVDDFTSDLLAPERYDLGRHQWTELELRRSKGKVEAKAIVHRASTHPIKQGATG